MYCNANDFSGKTDSDIIESAIGNKGDRIVFIPARHSAIEPERDYWLIDRAILLPENTTVILSNCKIKLSDKCRDNFFRTANCGIGITDIKPIKNVHIRGIGHCVLEGADHPRSTGDSTKILKRPAPKRFEDICTIADWVPEERRSPEKLNFFDVHGHTYGTDAGKEGESQHGDWRNIGILFASAHHCSISGIKITEPHGWAISLEDCSDCRIERIEFEACTVREIDGLVQNCENQDGIDLRNGCHDIIISDITGTTGDDIIALTAIANRDKELRLSGTLNSTHVMHNDWNKRCTDIYNVIIRNVLGYPRGGCALVRLLAAETKIYNVTVSNVVDTSPEGFRSRTALLIGEPDGEYGRNLPGSITRICASEIISDCDYPVVVEGYLENSVLSDIVNLNTAAPVVKVMREGGLKNVHIGAVSTVGKDIIG